MNTCIFAYFLKVHEVRSVNLPDDPRSLYLDSWGVYRVATLEEMIANLQDFSRGVDFDRGDYFEWGNLDLAVEVVPDRMGGATYTTIGEGEKRDLYCQSGETAIYALSVADRESLEEGYTVRTNISADYWDVMRPLEDEDGDGDGDGDGDE